MNSSTAHLGGFTFSLSSPAERDFDIPFSLSEQSTAEEEDFELRDPSGQVLSGSVPFQTGQQSVFVTLVPIDDDEPEWTETVILRVEETGWNYRIWTGSLEAKEEIVDNDLSIDGLPELLRVNNDDDDDNGIPDNEQSGPVAGEDDLYPVQLRFPEEVKAGAAVTLSAPNQIVHVWENADRSGEQFIGADQQWYTWTIGQQIPPQTVYVEAIAGSLWVGDIVLTLLATDMAVAPAPAHATTTSATTDAATSYGVAIRWQGQNVTNQSAGNVLIGQKIALEMEVVGPWTPAADDYVWTVPGPNFKDYIATDQLGKVVPWDPEDWTQSAITFYWSDGETDGVERQVFCAVKVKPGLIEQRWVKFDVYEPLSEFSLEVGGVGRGRDVLGGPHVRFGLLPDVGMNHGMVFSGRVELPQPFALGPAGEWYVTQLITSWNYLRLNDGTMLQVFRNGEPRLLDKDVRQNQRTFSTGAEVGQTVDSPHNPLDPGVMDWTGRDDEFFTYLMFIPPGGESLPVPLKKIELKWGGGVRWDPNEGWIVEDVVTPPRHGAQARYWDEDPPASDTNEHPGWPKNKAPTGWENMP